MNYSSSLPDLDLSTDQELVAACLAGDHTAFSPIVERYQRLLCSLAYSATGQLSQSEELAQEAFVEAWRQLPKLREPEKLRSWLCGILRHKVSRLHRTDGREPARQAEPLDAVAEFANEDTPAADIAVQKEEQAIMWSALERVPEIYREPLVLYYREHRSIEHVAVSLDLTEDAVKQRLSRGRKILQEKVLSFVEGALSRSIPGHVFTAAVLTAVSATMATPAKAAGIGVVAAKGGMIAKSAGLAALVASCSGVISAVLALRANLDQSRTPAERRTVVRTTIGLFGGAIAFLVGLYAIRAGALQATSSAFLWAISAQVFVFGFIAIGPVILSKCLRRMRELRSAERIRHPECFKDARDQVGSTAGTYRSKATLFGVPLVHVRYASPDQGEAPVVGWFAGGDRAYGLLMAWGAFAVAPVSVGVCAVGLLSVGTLSVGVISLGTVSVGMFAIGCAAVAIEAYAWLSALGWNIAAGGGFAVAHDAALSPIAFAENANNQAAVDFVSATGMQGNQIWYLVAIAVLTLGPVIAYATNVRRRLGRQ